MPIYSSLDRLNAMHDLFTVQGNQRLDAGEVQALAAFHGGLKGASQAKTRARMVEIYQTSKFSSGQQDSLRGLLVGQGFKLAELEKADPNTAAGFAKLSKGAQFDRIVELAGDYADDGATKAVKLSSLDMITRGKLEAGLGKVEKDIKKARGADAEIGDAQLAQVFVVTANGAKELVGYRAEVPIYADEHDVDEAHYFNTKGQHLGSEYVGE